MTTDSNVATLSLIPTQEAQTETSAIQRMPISHYCVLHAGQKSPEILIAEDDEQAWKQVQRKVRSGQIQAVHLYKLIGAEMFEPSSRRLTPEEVKNGDSLPPKD